MSDSKKLVIILITIVLGIAATLIAAVAWAEPICDELKPEHCLDQLEKGDVAQFGGVLMTPEMSISLGQKAEGCPERIRMAVSYTSSVARIRSEADLALADVDLRAQTASTALWKREALRAQERPFLEHPIVVATITAVVITAVYFAARGTQAAADKLFGQ